MSTINPRSSDSESPNPAVWKEGQQKSLLDLPNELIQHCYASVDPAGWGASRRVSKEMAATIRDGGPPDFPAETALRYFNARAEAGEEARSFCTTNLDLAGKMSHIDVPSVGGRASFSQLRQDMPLLKHFSGLLIQNGDTFRTVRGTLCPGRGAGVTLEVESPWIITAPGQSHTLRNVPFVGHTEDGLQPIINTEKISLILIRPPGSTHNAATRFPAFPKPRNIRLGVSREGTEADNTALVPSLVSLSNSLYQQYGPLHLNQVELCFAPTATASDYTAAIESVAESQHTIDRLVVETFNRRGGPQLRSLVTDPYLLKKIPCPEVTIRVDDQEGTGYSPMIGPSPKHGSSNGSSVALPTLPVVTFEQRGPDLAGFEELPAELRQHPGNEYRFASTLGGPLKAYSEAVQATMWPVSKSAVPQATHAFSRSVPGA